MTWRPSWWPFGRQPDEGRQPDPAPAPASVGAGALALESPARRGDLPAGRSTPQPSFLIVGLGNPGPQYVDTRHNAGFLVIDRLAERLGARLDTEVAGSRVGTGLWRGSALELAQPQTFMNRSGGAVEGLLRRAGLEASQMLLVYDDLALPVGQIRLRGKGSAGGHNGVQDVIDVLGSAEFPRLRVGVGDRFDRGKQVDYVLSPFDADEHDTVNDALDRAVEAALAVAHDGLVAAMNVHNRKV